MASRCNRVMQCNVIHSNCNPIPNPNPNFNPIPNTFVITE